MMPAVMAIMAVMNDYDLIGAGRQYRQTGSGKKYREGN